MFLLKSLIISLSIIFLVACGDTTKSFDLLDITFKDDNMLSILGDEKHAVYPNYISTSSEKLMVFNGIKVKKDYSDSSTPNYLVFYYKDNKPFYYSLTLQTTSIGKKVFEAIEKKFGKADYIGYQNDIDTPEALANSKPVNYIWEDKVGDRLFVFGDRGTPIHSLNVMPNPSSSNDILGMAQTGFWGDFVNARKRKKDPNYTYDQFIEDGKKEIFPPSYTTKTLGKNTRIATKKN